MHVCLNGHGANPARSSPISYCLDCGAALLCLCPICGEPIGEPGAVGGMGELTQPPAYCMRCLALFPWTEVRLEAARELLHDLWFYPRTTFSLMQVNE